LSAGTGEMSITAEPTSARRKRSSASSAKPWKP